MSYGNFYGGTPPHGDRDTSISAAESVIEDAGVWREKIYQEIHKAGADGRTLGEFEARGWLHQTAGPRIRELCLAGRIGDSGKRRRNRSGRWAIAWVIADLAPEQNRYARRPTKREILEALSALEAIWHATGGVGFTPALIKTIKWLSNRKASAA
jgi:hypothetical protein